MHKIVHKSCIKNTGAQTKVRTPGKLKISLQKFFFR